MRPRRKTPLTGREFSSESKSFLALVARFGRGFLVAAASAGVLSGSAVGQTAQPLTLPAMKIDTAALIGPSAADSYYPNRAITAASLSPATPPEIVELARALKYNPDLIYEYVHNNIDVAWMYGLQKGALGTLIDKSGTPFDQATLMMALLNQVGPNQTGGFTASYQAGTITPTPAQFTAWTGISDANAACQMLANGGIPAIINNQQNVSCSSVAGGIASITMAHIWIKVTIPNTSCNTGCLFDPSYKQYIKQTGIDLASATGLASDLPFPHATDNMQTGMIPGTSVPYVWKLSAGELNSHLATYAQNLLNCIQSDCKSIGTTAPQMEDILGGGVIVPYVSPVGGLRQSTLPYPATASHTWTCTPPVSGICNVDNHYRTILQVQGWTWNYLWTNGQSAEPQGQYDNMFNNDVNHVSPFFVDEIYGRALNVDTDYGNQDKNFYDATNKYANTVYLRLDGVTLASHTNPGMWEGYTTTGVPLYVTSRGAPSYFTLTIDHPYAAANDHTTTVNGTYMDATITKSVVLITPLTIVDGLGETSGNLLAKWSDEKAADVQLPYIGSTCPEEDPPGKCVNMYPGGQGDFEREKLAANWLAQYSRAARLNAAIAGVVPQLHHALGFVYGDALISPTYSQSPPWNENPDYSQVDNFNRLDVDSAISMSSRTADASARRAAIFAFAATAATLEGAAAQQMDDLPDGMSTASRFEWGNAPPGTLDNWEAPHCTDTNAYEDPGCPGARKFVQYTSANSGQAGSVDLIENHVLDYYTGFLGGAPPGAQPTLSAGEAGGWNTAYVNEIAAYTTPAANYTVVTSQEAFLGPGQRGGGSINWQVNHFNGITTYDPYYHTPTKQRGPAFVATKYDPNNNLDPLFIAHDVVALGSYGDGIYATKGGGGGSQSNQGTSYSPNDAADILKSRFVDKSNALGVNLSNGSIGYTAPAKLDVGNGGFPYELSAEYQWNPAPRNPAFLSPQSPVAPTPGWTTNWNNRLAMSGSGMEAMGKSDVRAAVGTIATFLAAQSIYANSPTAQRDVAGLLAMAWWARQMSGNVITVSLGTSTRQFLGLPQGVTLPGTSPPVSWFAPGSNTYSTLAMSGTGRVPYEQKCTGPNPGTPYAPSRGWNYSGIPTVTITNPHGDQQSFAYWSNTYSLEGDYECGFAQGFRLASWTFPQGPSVTLTYGNKIDYQKPNPNKGFDQLVKVQNSVGREIDFTTDGFIVTGFNNTQSRSVSLSSSPITQTVTITDPAAAATTMVALAPTKRSDTVRPVGHPLLYQIYTPDKPAVPNLQYDYDALGRVKQVEDAEILQVGDRGPYSFFIADGTRGERDDPLGDAWSVTYDTYGHPARYIDERGYETDAMTDGRGRVTQYTYPETDCEVFGYDDHNNTTSYKRVDETSSCNVNAGAAHVLSVSAVWDQGWNKPTQITDANGNQTNFQYFGSNPGASLLETATRPADANGNHPIYSFTYDPAGKLLTSTDPVTTTTSITTQNTYSTDGLKNLLSTQIDPAGKNLKTSFSYNTDGDIATTTDPLNKVTSFTYDNNRRKLESHHHDGNASAPLNQATRTVYDPLGRDTEEDTAKCFDNPTTCPGSGTTIATWTATKTTTYTPTSKVATVTDADGRVSSTTYDGADRTSVVTDPALRQSKFTYDPTGNVLTETRGLGTQDEAVYATYTYGAEGEKLSVTDADGASHLTQYAYDGFNRLATTTYPDASTEQITLYDANSNIKTKVNRAGQTFTYTYDALNRMLTKVIPAYGSTAANTITTAYDLGGRITQTSDTPGDIVALTRDTAGRVTKTTTTVAGSLSAVAASYTLDKNGNRTKLTWPGGYFVGYCYDSLNRMTAATANATDCVTNLLATYSYDTFSRRTTLAYGASAAMTYGYTPAGDLTNFALNMASSANDNTWTLGFSNAHQLTSDAASLTAYKWQPAANGTDTYATVNVLNQYPSVTPQGAPGARLQSYDADGNLIGDSTYTYSYDPENRLVTASKTGLAAIYSYDPLGRRQKKSGTGVTTTVFLQDGEDEIAEYDGSGNVVRRFVPGPAINDPIAMVPASGTVEVFYGDHHGSVTAMSDASGNLLEGPFTYDACGNMSGATTGEPFRYTGQYLDVETGLYYDRARYFGPDSTRGCRFLQPDAVGYTADLNLYTYGSNDPVNKTDPTGMDDASAVLYYAGVGQSPTYYSTPAGEEEGAESTEQFAEMLDAASAGLMSTGVGTPEAGALEEVAGGLRGVASEVRAESAVLRNAAQGARGEAATEAKLGDKLAGKQVTFRTSDNTRTRADFVTKDRTVVETKTGGGGLRPGQKKLHSDIARGRHVTPVGKNAAKAGLKPGQPTIMKGCIIDRPC